MNLVPLRLTSLNALIRAKYAPPDCSKRVFYLPVSRILRGTNWNPLRCPNTSPFDQQTTAAPPILVPTLQARGHHLNPSESLRVIYWSSAALIEQTNDDIARVTPCKPATYMSRQSLRSSAPYWAPVQSINVAISSRYMGQQP